MDSLKQKYNELLARQKKAEKWMDNAKPADQEKHFGRYKDILLNMEKQLILLRNAGVNVSAKEMFEGF